MATTDPMTTDLAGFQDWAKNVGLGGTDQAYGDTVYQGPYAIPGINYGISQDRVNWMNQTYGTSYKDPIDYAQNYLWPGATTIQDPTYGTVLKLPQGYSATSYANQPQAYAPPESSFLGLPTDFLKAAGLAFGIPAALSAAGIMGPVEGAASAAPATSAAMPVASTASQFGPEAALSGSQMAGTFGGLPVDTSMAAAAGAAPLAAGATGSFINPGIDGAIENIGSGASSALGIPNAATGAAPTPGAPVTPPASPTAPGGTPGGVPGVTPPGGAAAPGGPPTAPGGGTPAAAGGDFMKSITDQLKKNALSLGITGLLAAKGAGGTGQPLQVGGQLQAGASAAQGASQAPLELAQQFITAAQQGQLTPYQQSQLDQFVQQAKNQVRNYFASIGQYDSTSRIQAEQQIDQQALGYKQQLIQDTLNSGLASLQSGLSAIGASQGPLNTLAQYQIGQDRNLQQAMGNFAQAVGSILGTGAGKPTVQIGGTTNTTAAA